MDAGDRPCWGLESLVGSIRFALFPNTWNRICAREYPPSPDSVSSPRLFFIRLTVTG
jgi:hypothetical protein